MNQEIAKKAYIRKPFTYGLSTQCRKWERDQNFQRGIKMHKSSHGTFVAGQSVGLFLGVDINVASYDLETNGICTSWAALTDNSME